MDVGVVRDRICATLSSEADTRRQAELDLKHVSIGYPTAQNPLN